MLQNIFRNWSQNYLLRGGGIFGVPCFGIFQIGKAFKELFGRPYFRRVLISEMGIKPFQHGLNFT
jgi:hypothetical protein